MEESLQRKYLSLMNKVINLRRSYRELRDREARLREQIDYVQARVTDYVCNAKDESGKMLYSNDIHRKAAVTMKVQEDAEYKRLSQELAAVRFYLSEASDRFFLLSEKKNLLSLDLMGDKAQFVLFYEGRNNPNQDNIESRHELYSKSVMDIVRPDQDIKVDLRLTGS